MKKTIAKVLIMALMLSAFCLTALAAFEGAAPADVAVMRASGTIKLNKDMGAGYNYSPNGGALHMTYYPNHARAWTLIAGSAGYSYVHIKGNNGSTDYSYGYSVVGGYVDSGIADVPGADRALTVIHSGYKTVNGVNTSYAYECS